MRLDPIERNALNKALAGINAEQVFLFGSRVDDYLPEKLKELKDMIMGDMRAELSSAKHSALKLELAKNGDY